MNFQPTVLTVAISLATLSDSFGQNVADTVRSMPAFVTPGYVTSRTMGEAEVDLDTWTDETAKAISKARPGAYTPNPPIDRVVIRSVYKSMKANRATTGFSSEFILQAIHTAWINLAIKPFDRTGKEPDISEDDITNTASGMREVIIRTEPTGAIIKIDGYRGYSPSNTHVFLEPGKKHAVVLEKNGYDLKDTTIIIDSKTPTLISPLIKLKAVNRR